MTVSFSSSPHLIQRCSMSAVEANSLNNLRIKTIKIHTEGCGRVVREAPGSNLGPETGYPE